MKRGIKCSHVLGGCGGVTESALDSGSRGPGPIPGVIVLCFCSSIVGLLCSFKAIS